MFNEENDMNWYVKAFSALTKISVATLHHYDAVGLLKPSIRMPNGYRLYSERDLLKLERIVALKFFGFSLQKIKVLVGNDEEVLDHLTSQISFLDEQIKQLHQAQAMANTIVAEINTRKTIDWSLVVSLIKAYQMTKKLNKTWAGKIYTEQELKQFATVDEQYTEDQKVAFRKLWAELFAEAGKSLDKDPKSPIGKQLGLQYVLLKQQLQEAYKNYPELWEKMWQVREEGKVPDEAFLGTKEQQNWLEQAAKTLK